MTLTEPDSAEPVADLRVRHRHRLAEPEDNRAEVAQRRSNARRYGKRLVCRHIGGTTPTIAAISKGRSLSDVFSKLDRIAYVISPLLRESPLP